ncbi:MAG: GNAT family N-acetyltransferase [Anaerolineales bacterium]|nr:MAG: GNAT family N-acetyltransferase [Anaerolineales bacterium]
MHIRLRPVIISDLPILFEQQADPESSAMAAFPSRTKEEFDTHWAKIMADETVILRVIEVDGQVAGHLVSWEMREGREVGYWLGREFWGKGIATESLNQFLGVVKTRPLFAHVAKHNTASRRVLEKCGFTVIGEDKYTNRIKQKVEEFVLRLNEND